MLVGVEASVSAASFAGCRLEACTTMLVSSASLRYIGLCNPTTGVSQRLTKVMRGYRPRERSEGQVCGCPCEAPTADAVGISREPGTRMPRAYASGWI